MGLRSTRRHSSARPFSRRLMRSTQHFGQPVDRSELAVATTDLTRRTRSSRRHVNECIELGGQVRYRRLGVEHQCPVHPADAEQAIGRIQVCELPIKMAYQREPPLAATEQMPRHGHSHEHKSRAIHFFLETNLPYMEDKPLRGRRSVIHKPESAYVLTRAETAVIDAPRPPGASRALRPQRT